MQELLLMKPPNLVAKTRKEVADEYCISERTLFRWLKRANIKLTLGLIRPCDLRIIYDTFGIPKRLKFDLVS
jgi:hypothetical protein